MRDHGRAENQRSGEMLDVVDHLYIRNDEASQGRERLAERAHDDIDLVVHTEMGGRAVALFPEHPDEWAVVDHQTYIVIPQTGYDLRQRSDVPFHAEDAVDDDQSAVFGLAFSIAFLRLSISLCLKRAVFPKLI